MLTDGRCLLGDAGSARIANANAASSPVANQMLRALYMAPWIATSAALNHKQKSQPSPGIPNWGWVLASCLIGILINEAYDVLGTVASACRFGTGHGASS